MIIAIFIFFLLFLWVLFSIKAVGPNEMGVWVFFGKLTRFVNSGFAFIPLFPKSGLKKYPKTLFNLDYPSQKIITKAGEYREKGKGKKKNGKTKEYGKQLIEVDSVVYMRFPQFFQKPFSKGLRDDNVSPDEVGADAENMCIGLKRIAEQNIPTDAEGLKKWTRDTVASSLRNIFGEVTWVEATENLKDLREKLKKHFSDSVNALTQAGFSPADLDIEIQEVRLTKELEDLLQEPDKARLKSEAAVFTARKQAAEQVGSVVEAFALARGKSVKTIQRELNKDAEQRKEFLSYIKNINLRLEEADRNALIDIRVGDGNGNDRGDFLGSIIKAIAASKLLGEKSKEKGTGEKTEKKEKKDEKEVKSGRSRIEEERKKRNLSENYSTDLSKRYVEERDNYFRNKKTKK